MTTAHRTVLLAFLVAAATLAGCGSRGDSSPTSPGGETNPTPGDPTDTGPDTGVGLLPEVEAPSTAPA